MRILGVLIGLLISLRGLCLPGGNFVFLLDSVAANSNGQVNVPVRALNFDSIMSIQGTIGFDTAELSFAGVQAYGLPSMSNGNFGLSLTGSGMLTFSWNEVNLLPISILDSSILFEVVFQVLGLPGSQTPVEFLSGPTIFEVVGVGFNVLPYALDHGSVTVKVPPTCPTPDSLDVSGVGQALAQLNWYSANPGAAYLVEWGPLGFTPGTGMGQATGISVAGLNTVQATGLLPDSSYAFYIQEQCATLASPLVGPHEFQTAAVPVAVPVVLFADTVAGYAGDLVDVGVRVRDFVGIISMQFSMTWDTAVAQFVAIQSYGLPAMGAGNFNVAQAGNGVVVVSWNDPTLLGVSLPDSGAVFSLRFQVVSGIGAVTPVTYANSPLPIEVVDGGFVPLPFTTINGQIERLDTSTTVAVTPGMNVNAHIQVYPHPIGMQTTEIHVQTGMAASAVLRVDMVDLFGKVLSPQCYPWTAGEGAIIIHLRDGLPTGQYVLRIHSVHGATHHRIMNLGK